MVLQLSKLLPYSTPILLSRLAKWLNMVKVQANSFFLLIHLTAQASHIELSPFRCLKWPVSPANHFRLKNLKVSIEKVYPHFCYFHDYGYCIAGGFPGLVVVANL